MGTCGNLQDVWDLWELADGKKMQKLSSIRLLYTIFELKDSNLKMTDDQSKPCLFLAVVFITKNM